MDDILYMKEALKEAEAALREGEIPVGSIIVKEGRIVGRGRNCRLSDRSPFGHAEIAAMVEASNTLRTWRFDDCILYVTLEPCAMCAGAIVQSRLGTLVFGAKDPRAGAAGSLYNIPEDPRSYHKCVVRSGILKNECALILQNFFIQKRGGNVQR